MNNKEVVKKWFASIDEKNFDSIKSLTGSRHVFHNPMSPEPVDAEHHIGMMHMMTSALEGKHHIELILAEGEYVTVRGKWSGKHTGEFNGVPATGNKVEFTFTDIFHIVNGKVEEEYLEMNPMAIMTQIGAMPANA